MQQGWLNIGTSKICTSFCKSEYKREKIMIFFPGLGQSKAGSYFFYTEIAQKFKSEFDTLQVDFIGFGDSEGELEEISYNDIVYQFLHIIKLYENEYEEIIIITSGFANKLAEYATKYSLKVKAILIEPFLGNIKKFDSYRYVMEKYLLSEKYIDTSEIYEKHSDAEEVFLILGEGYNRCKGLYCRVDLLYEMLNNACVESINSNMIIFTSKKYDIDKTICIGNKFIPLSPESRKEVLNKIEEMF